MRCSQCPCTLSVTEVSFRTCRPDGCPEPITEIRAGVTLQKELNNVHRYEKHKVPVFVNDFLIAEI